ncbi:MAG: phosphatidylserine/phosphatidylglycerophosphate/cardiolipin synthase family protein [Patescibacteria group bacterium]
MKYKIYTTSKRAWQGMVNSIKKAKKYIYIEMYILDNEIGIYNFIDLLLERARQGVEVVLVLDAYGSSSFRNFNTKRLKEKGIEVLFFSKWLRRTHRKILIIDDRIAFLGGVNFHKQSIDWIDLQVKIDNKSLVKNVLRSFSYTYQMSGGTDKRIIRKRKHSVFSSIKAQFLEHVPGHNIYALEDYYRERIMKAEKSISITTPYFLPPRWLIAILDNAVLRGIRVDIILPRVTDLKLVNRINHLYVRKMKDLGINFYAYKKMNHSKILLVDDKEVLIGSQNLDFFSFRVNVESGVFISDKKLVADLTKLVSKWRDDSSVFNIDNIRVGLRDRIVLVFIRFFYSIL